MDWHPSLPTHDNRDMGVMHHIVANTPQDGATKRAEATGSHDDHNGLFLLGSIDYHLSWATAEHGLDATRQL